MKFLAMSILLCPLTAYAWGIPASTQAPVTATISDPCTWIQNAGKCYNGVLTDGIAPESADIILTDPFGVRLVPIEPTPSHVPGYIDYNSDYE